LGFTVWGLGFRIRDLGLRGLRFKVWGLEFRARGFGVMV